MSIVKRGQGRPRKISPGSQELQVIPDRNLLVIQDLKNHIQVLENVIKAKENPANEIKEYAEIIRIVQRAAKGLSPEDDVFQGLINVKDIKERTRLDENALLSHSAMRLAGEQWPELKLFQEIAEMEDPYFISLEGEGRKEGILLQQAKTGADKNNLVLNMPNTNGGPAQNLDPNAPPTQPKKPGFFSRFNPLKR